MKIFGEFDDYDSFLLGVYFIIYLTGSVMILFGFTFAGLFSRKRFSKVRFLIWFFAFILITALVLLNLFVLLLSTDYLLNVFSAVAFLLTIVIFLITLPYILLAFYSPIYRERFDNIFRLKKT